MSGIHNPPDWEREMSSRLSYELHEANQKLAILTKLAKNVQLMRKLQKEWFKNHDRSVLEQSKNMEKMIDNDLKEILEPEDKSQTKLFG